MLSDIKVIALLAVVAGIGAYIPSFVTLMLLGNGLLLKYREKKRDYDNYEKHE